MSNGEKKPSSEAMEQAKRRYPAIAAGHNHAEAFNLMWYSCVRRPEVSPNLRMSAFNGCGHNEAIWNSRDGVTPFGTVCPSCGGDMVHSAMNKDQYRPDYKPRYGQKVWTGMTRERAQKLAQERLRRGLEYHQREAPDEPVPAFLTLENLTEDTYSNGSPPMLAVAYADWFPEGSNGQG